MQRDDDDDDGQRGRRGNEGEIQLSSLVIEPVSLQLSLSSLSMT